MATLILADAHDHARCPVVCAAWRGYGSHPGRLGATAACATGDVRAVAVG